MKKVYSVVNHSGSLYMVLPRVISRKLRPRKVKIEIISQDEEKKEVVMKIKVVEERSLGCEAHRENDWGR